MGGIGSTIGNMAMNRLKKSPAGQMYGTATGQQPIPQPNGQPQPQQRGGAGAAMIGQAINRYRMGQAQNGLNNGMNQQMTGSTSGAPNMNGLMGGRGDGSSVPGNEPGGSNGEYGQFGQNPDAPIDDNDMPAMASGGIVNKPTVALLGEKGPEAVVPLNNPNAKVTPGMFTRSRYRPATGPSMVHGPMRPMAPAAMDDKMNPKKSNWHKFDSEHPRV